MDFNSHRTESAVKAEGAPDEKEKEEDPLVRRLVSGLPCPNPILIFSWRPTHPNPPPLSLSLCALQVSRSSHLVQYAKWLCLEALPVVADRDRENREKLGPLRETVRESERKKREELLNISPLSEAVTECRKLIKDFERYKNRAENIQIGYFALPVDQAMLSNYSVYVRNPIDLSTIRTKLGV